MDPVLIGSGLLIVGLVVWGVCVYYAYQMAKQRHRRPGVWAALTIIFGPFGLFALALLPPGERPSSGGRSSNSSADARSASSTSQTRSHPNRKKRRR